MYHGDSKSHQILGTKREAACATPDVPEQYYDGVDRRCANRQHVNHVAMCGQATHSARSKSRSAVYESSDSGGTNNSMQINANRAVTPPFPQPDSPGPTAVFGRLSLDQVRRDDLDKSSSDQTGRGRTQHGAPAPAKRAATSPLSRPGKSSPSQQHGRDSHQYGSSGATSRPRPRVRQGGKKVTPYVGSATQGGQTNNSTVSTTGGGKPDEWTDSAYEAIDSGRRPSGSDSIRLNTLPDHTQWSTPLTEEPKGVVTRLAGPVPVLIDSRYPKLIMQPESSPISQDQLAAEVRGIYGGLVMVEAKCMNIDAAQAKDPSSTLGPEQWQALIALHRTLLYEHHDFLMATQHPSATPALSGLAQKYSMPARMWRHGIHAFLEVLRHRRPQSQDYMLSFIYLAYQMMALLFETVPAFTDTWIECLGDLARYRMAIEEEKEAHSIWGGVAARWYNLASDRHPQIGRLYHHLGILERPSLRKLFMYAKSLTCVLPFPNARDSLNTLCTPIVQGNQSIQQGIPSGEAVMIRYHAYLFAESDKTQLPHLSSEIASELSQQPSAKLKENGVLLLVTSLASLFELGASTNQLWAYFNQSINRSIHTSRPSASAFPKGDFGDQTDGWPVHGTVADSSVYDLCYSSMQRIMNRGKDRQSLTDVLPSVHTALVWLYGIHEVKSNSNDLDNTIGSLFDRFAWVGLCNFLNTLIRYEPISGRTQEDAHVGCLPGSDQTGGARPKPLSEDFLIRGLIWCHSYFPEDWFDGQGEDDGRFFETPAMHKLRVERVQWLGLLLAMHTKYLKFDEAQQQFHPCVVPHRTAISPSLTHTSQNQSIRVPGRAEEHRVASTPKSRSSSTLSAHSDSDGYTIINSSKSKMSYAKAALMSHDGVKVIDDDDDVHFGI